MTTMTTTSVGFDHKARAALAAPDDLCAACSRPRRHHGDDGYSLHWFVPSPEMIEVSAKQHALLLRDHQRLMAIAVYLAARDRTGGFDGDIAMTALRSLVDGAEFPMLFDRQALDRDAAHDIIRQVWRAGFEFGVKAETDGHCRCVGCQDIESTTAAGVAADEMLVRAGGKP